MAFSSIWQLTKIVQQQACTNYKPFFPPCMHSWTGNCDSLVSNLLSGTVAHIQICLRWSHTGRFTEEMFLKTAINAGKQVASYFIIILANTLTHKWNSDLNWDFMYLLWEQRKLLRSLCNILKRKTLMKSLNYFNVLWHTLHWNNWVCEQTECNFTAVLLSLTEMALNTSAALHIASQLLILMIPR